MKIKLLSLIVIAAAIVACEPNNEPKNESGKRKTVITVGMASCDNAASVTPRKIYGQMTNLDVEDLKGMYWYWNTDEKLNLQFHVGEGTETEVFSLTSIEQYHNTEKNTDENKGNGWADFKGVIPDGFDIENGTFDIVSGPNQENPDKNQELTPNDIKRDKMKFIANGCKLSNDPQNNPVILIPQWAVLGLRFNLTQVITGGDGGNDVSSAKATVEKIEVYMKSPIENTDEPDYVVAQPSNTDEDELIKFTKSKGTTTDIPVMVIPKKYENGLTVKVYVKDVQINFVEGKQDSYTCTREDHLTFTTSTVFDCSFKETPTTTEVNLPVPQGQLLNLTGNITWNLASKQQ